MLQHFVQRILARPVDQRVPVGAIRIGPRGTERPVIRKWHPWASISIISANGWDAPSSAPMR
jgi:hypothetical protein